MKFNILTILMISLVFCSWGQGIQPGNNGVITTGQSAGGDETVEQLLHQWKDDEIFLDIAGQDRVRWGLIREVLTLRLNAFTPPPGMGREGVEGARKMAFRVILQKMLKNYIRYGVIAAEARKQGLKITPQEFEEQRKQARLRYTKIGASGAPYLELMKKPESLYEHNLTNALLWRAYTEKVLEPAIPVAETNIEQRIVAQHTANLAAVATNAVKFALIREIHGKVKGGIFGYGQMDFAEAAAKWSDDTTSETGGVYMDENEQPQRIKHGDLCKEIEAAYKKLDVGEISGVIETPYSWHIIKLLARHPANGNSPETVELANIMLEKVELLPELTREQARKKLLNVQVRKAMEKKTGELLTSLDIKCKIPLFGERPKNGGPKKTFRKISGK